MLAENMKVGQEVWFKTCNINKAGKKEWVINSGVISNIDKKKISLEGTRDTQGQYEVHPVVCFEHKCTLESEIKWDSYMDNFQDKLMAVAQTYIDKMNNIVNIAKGLSNGYVQSKMSPNTEFIIQDTKLKMKMLGSQFKTKVGEFTDNFLKKTQETGLEQMERERKALLFHTDLSQYESHTTSDVVLEDSDLSDVSLNIDSDIKLEESDLCFTTNNGLVC